MTIKDIKDQGLLLLECISGSKAYGLATERSDTDLKGVFYLPKEQFYGLKYVDQVSNENNDEVYYELGRFIDLLIKNNPNMLELLGTPAQSILYRHPVMDQLPIELFLSKLCKETFAGYALTQIQKARGYNKKIVNPVDKERKTVLDFCFILLGPSAVPLADWLQHNNFVQERCGLARIDHTKGMYALYYDHGGILPYRGIMSTAEVNEVSMTSIPIGHEQQAHLFFNQEGYSAYCKAYREYWDWVQKRNDDRYHGNMTHGKGYDAKNMMHTIRLLQVAEELLRTGQLYIVRPNREELLSIKAGDYEYEDLLARANVLMQQIEDVEPSSGLPDKPDRSAIEAKLIAIRETLYA